MALMEQWIGLSEITQKASSTDGSGPDGTLLGS
jgi:hypothetical protein